MHRPTPIVFDAVVPAPFGCLGLHVRDGHLTGIDLLPASHPLLSPCCEPARRAADQLAAYFRDAGVVFDLPLAPQGTPFRQRVWRAIGGIACGETRTYGELANWLGSAPRAVGQAVGDNPLPIVIPCHRVIGRHGLGGFAHADSGPSLAIKRWLLRHEGALGR